MGAERRSFIPAAGRDWLLPFYDPLQWLLGGDAARRTLIEQAELGPDHEVLDIGCGTGSLIVQIARWQPTARITGLDPDPKALARARRKAARAGVAAGFQEGFSDALPCPPASFDRVFSSFMFHHLGSDEKRGTLHEVRRVLRPGGSFHLVDFGGTGTHADGWLARLLHSAEDLHENAGDRLLAGLREAGFAEARELAQRRTPFGQIAFYRASP